MEIKPILFPNRLGYRYSVNFPQLLLATPGILQEPTSPPLTLLVNVWEVYHRLAALRWDVHWQRFTSLTSPDHFGKLDLISARTSAVDKWKDASVFLPSEMRNWRGRWRRRWAKNSKWIEDDVNQVGEEDGKGGSYEDDIGGMRGVKEWICPRRGKVRYEGAS